MMTTTGTGITKIVFIILLALLLAGCAADPQSDLPPVGPENQTLEEGFEVEMPGETDESADVDGTAGTEKVAEATEDQFPADPENSLPAETPNPAPGSPDTVRSSTAEAGQPIGSDGIERAPSPDTTMESGEAGADKLTVLMTIRNREGLPDIITGQPVDWEPGDTVLDLLIRMTRAQRIHLAYRGRGRTGYVEGINNLYEFDHGPASGWVYSVNGVFPNRSAGGWETAPGDEIVWWYTLDAGRDVGAMAR